MQGITLEFGIFNGKKSAGEKCTSNPTPLEQGRELQERLEDALSCFKKPRLVLTEELQTPVVKYRYRAIECFLTVELGYVQGMMDCFSSNPCWLLEEKCGVPSLG